MEPRNTSSLSSQRQSQAFYACKFLCGDRLFIRQNCTFHNHNDKYIFMSEQQNNARDSLQDKRHTLAHLLAAAVAKLYPDAKPTIGPAIDNGFYYDFAFSEPITEADLKKIEKQMRKILPAWNEMVSEKVTPDQAREIYKENKYKLELIDEIQQSKNDITLYTAGKDESRDVEGYTDLCKGGHSENPSKDIPTKSFTLSSLAGAYWRGDEKNDQLTRIYGLSFHTKEELDEYKKHLEEAKKRDHRKIGKELDLFTFSDLVGSGLPLWTPKGTLLRELIVDKIQNLQAAYGYERVVIPHITKKDLYEKSGHWEKFGDELFKVKGQSDQEFVLKPMNCPHHAQIYASKPRSYRDLPQRYMEVTMQYRDEQAGELLGLSRVRSISIDDGHVFAQEKDIEHEILNIIDVIKKFYGSLGLFEKGKYWVSISVRDPQKPADYLGDTQMWKRAESMLIDICKEQDMKHKIMPGEAAFYGPKIDFMFKDALDREWQLATIQLDFVQPERFNLEYTDIDGEKKRPVMIHRAIAGSLERFLSVIIEHFAGAFPLWLSPVQMTIIPVTSDFDEYGTEVRRKLQREGFRVEISNESETLGKRIKLAQAAKTPYMLIVGEKESKTGSVAVRSREDGDQGEIILDDFIEQTKSIIMDIK